jgi:hypothetical protein
MSTVMQHRAAFLALLGSVVDMLLKISQRSNKKQQRAP